METQETSFNCPHSTCIILTLIIAAMWKCLWSKWFVIFRERGFNANHVLNKTGLIQVCCLKWCPHLRNKIEKTCFYKHGTDFSQYWLVSTIKMSCEAFGSQINIRLWIFWFQIFTEIHVGFSLSLRRMNETLPAY